MLYLYLNKSHYIKTSSNCKLSCVLKGYSVALQRKDSDFFGFGIKQSGPGFFEISHITPFGTADKNGKIARGDNVIAINDVALTESMNLEMITTMVRETGNTLRLTLNSKNRRQGNILIATIDPISNN